MNKNIIVVNNLTKKYKITDKFALEGIDLKIRQGSIFGLLGPNGAGKSTFINILAGLVNKTSGQVKVFDLDLDTNPKTNTFSKNFWNIDLDVSGYNFVKDTWQDILFREANMENQKTFPVVSGIGVTPLVTYLS